MSNSCLRILTTSSCGAFRTVTQKAIVSQMFTQQVCICGHLPAQVNGNSTDLHAKFIHEIEGNQIDLTLLHLLR